MTDPRKSLIRIGLTSLILGAAGLGYSVFDACKNYKVINANPATTAAVDRLKTMRQVEEEMEQLRGQVSLKFDESILQLHDLYGEQSLRMNKSVHQINNARNNLKIDRFCGVCAGLLALAGAGFVGSGYSLRKQIFQE